MKKLIVCLLLLCSSNALAFDLCTWDYQNRYITKEICDLVELEKLDFNCDVLPDKFETDFPDPDFDGDGNAARECHTFQALKAEFIESQELAIFPEEGVDNALLFYTYIDSANNYMRASCQFLASRGVDELYPFVYLKCMNGRLKILIDEIKKTTDDVVQNTDPR